MDVRSGVAMFDAHEGLRRLASFPFGLLTWVDRDGYPISAAVEMTVDLTPGQIDRPVRPFRVQVDLHRAIAIVDE